VYALEEGLHLIRRSYCRAAVSARLAAKSKDIVRPSNALAMWKLKGLYADDWSGSVGTSGTPIAASCILAQWTGSHPACSALDTSDHALWLSP